MKFSLSAIADYEDERTTALFEILKPIKNKGYFTKKQLIKVLKWKSDRPSQHYNLNTDKEIREVTALAFASKSETLKIHILTALSGVGYPTASAILMFYDRKKYPVIDIRVWKQLYNAKLVFNNAGGKNFTLRQWVDYLAVIRNLAKVHNLTARQVEKRIFDHDVKTRKGNLY